MNEKLTEEDKEYLKDLYEQELERVKSVFCATIKGKYIMELNDDKDENLHTNIIKTFEDYIQSLQDLIGELKEE